MPHTETRTDIRMSDVFISWTGKDRELKDRIVRYLREHQVTVLESDYECVGDFRTWSREAASKCTVFLLLHTENTVDSKYVPVEIEEFKKQDNWQNRFLPVVLDYSLYAKERPDLAKSESVICLDSRQPGEASLNEVLHKVQLLIKNCLLKQYREATKPTYLKLKSFLRMVRAQDREFDYESLYISRTVTDEDQNTIADAAVFANGEDIFFLQGPAGSGKSSYIDQLRKAAGEDVLVMALSCRKLTNTPDLFSAMFEEFHRQCGNRYFYTREDFQNLLSAMHLLLVLDGMDEIATKNGTRQFLDAVSDYYKANAVTTTLFFTSRNEDDADVIAMNGQTPKRLKLCSLEEDQIEAFGEKLFLLLEKPDKSEAFYVRVKDLADEIRTNPLLLSQLAIIYDTKGEIPQTTVGIYDTVCEITLSQEANVTNVPPEYRSMVTLELAEILKAFSAERYRLLSEGKDPATVKILAAVLKNTYSDARERAAFLEEYLRDRAMIVDGEFYHKMLLEYFTAVYYYEHCFDDYNELKDSQLLESLFSHYDDLHWSAVLQLFLVKADSLIDSRTTEALYNTIMTYGITEYTLLFNACRELLYHQETVQRTLLCDLLQKSTDGTYPPYGPLFWYVPEYALYAQLLQALESLTDETSFPKALALTRDVCWIFGRYHTASQITDRVDGAALFLRAAEIGIRRGLGRLFSRPALTGVRRGLCQLFYTGATDKKGGDDIYPRCFNIAEAKHWMEQDRGLWGRMKTGFRDELGLYSHEMFSRLGDEYIGIVAAPYDRDYIESVLPQKSCKKLCGLFLSPTDDRGIYPLAINDRHIKMAYTPENAHTVKGYHNACLLGNGLLYFDDTVQVPDGVTEIGESAFSDCTSLKEIKLPDSVTEIGEYAFENCTALTEITIPGSVTKIGYAAFRGCTSLTSIAIPDSVIEIEWDAFAGCTSLTEITIPSSVTEIGAAAFKGCTSLVEIKLPDCVRRIAFWVFENCTSLTEITIPSSVTEIGQSAFKGCTSLTSIAIPDRVTKIEWDAFAGCTSLTSIAIPDNVTNIRKGAFSGCTSLTEITIPSSVTEIGMSVFKNCTSLTEIEIPDSVTVIGKGAFSDCTELRRIDNCPPGYTHDDLGVTEDCVICTRQSSGIDILAIPQGVERIGFREYYGRRDLQKVILPDSVIEIEESAFEGCTSLTEITIPSSVTEIGKSAFKGCASLKEIKLPDSVTKIGGAAFEDCASLKEIKLPDSVTKIERDAFAGCTSLTEITIPSSVTEIGKSAFAGCTSLTEITIPSSVTEIGKSAFRGCASLKEIKLPDSVTKIGYAAFSGCASLKEIKLPDSVTKFEGRTFAGCTSLTEIEIPDSVIEIGWHIFEGCTSLTEIKLPNSATEIGWDTFKGCTSLTSIAIPDNVTNIRKRAFSGCTSLTEITIPSSVTEIGAGAFENCTALTEITIPSSVTEIGYAAFADCASLQSITIPKGVRIIYDGAFKNCTGLKALTISRRFEDDLSRVFPGVDLSKATIHWL